MRLSVDAYKKALPSIVAVLIAMAFVDLVFNVTSYGEDLTSVEGVLSQNTAWTLRESPYVITGDVLIADGTTLTVEPGVEIRFGGNFSLIIEGSLYAVGNNDSWITFTSNSLSPNAGDWNTINFVGSSNESFTMKNCIVEYARIGVTVQSLGRATVENSKIVSNSFSGIHVIGKGNLIIRENIIRLNKNGVSSSGNTSSGIEILDNIVDSNQNGIYLLASSRGTSQINNVTISGNTFSRNEEGIQFKVFPNTWGIINNVIISRNTLNFNRNGIYLYIWGGFIDYARNHICDVSISRNIVYSNEEYGICLYSGGPWLGSIYRVSISDNCVCSNEIGIHLFGNTHDPYVEFDVTVSNNTVSTNADKGIYIYGGGYPEEGIKTNITRNSFSYNAYGVFCEGATANIGHFNDIYCNTYGAYVSRGATVNATYNYWGKPSGPYHDLLNPTGEGNPVNGDGTDLLFKPFLSSPAVNKRPIAVLEVDKTGVTTDQMITFNATRSSDDTRINGYFFDFDDDTDSGWITQPLVEHAYTSPGIYTASLKVLDDLGFESNNTALAILNVQLTLSVSIDANCETVQSGEHLILTIHVTDGSNPIADANVTLSADDWENFAPQTGETNSTGHFVSVFTAPTVTEEKEITIAASVSKTGYWDGQSWLEVDVLPHSANIIIDFVWVLAPIALAVVSIFLAFRFLRIKGKKLVH